MTRASFTLQDEHEALLAAAQQELQSLREEHTALLELAAGLEVEVERLRVKEVGERHIHEMDGTVPCPISMGAGRLYLLEGSRAGGRVQWGCNCN
jgi:hypothetical protein